MTPVLSNPRCGRRVLGGAAVGVLLLGMTGCGSLGTDTNLSAAQVRFVEVSPGSPEMDFYVNGAGAAYGVGFENFTTYLPVSSGAASLSVSRTGMGQTLAGAQTVLGGGRQYTAIVSHGLGSLQERVYADQDTAAPAGQIALRLLNEVEGADSLTFHVSPTSGNGVPPLVITTPAGAVSGYTTVPAAGEYTVVATVSERGLNIPVGSVIVKAGSGAVRSVVFAGTAQPGVRTGVVGFVLTDADAP